MPELLGDSCYPVAARMSCLQSRLAIWTDSCSRYVFDGGNTVVGGLNVEGMGMSEAVFSVTRL
jgi:hypothetical protein